MNSRMWTTGRPLLLASVVLAAAGCALQGGPPPGGTAGAPVASRGLAAEPSPLAHAGQGAGVDAVDALSAGESPPASAQQRLLTYEGEFSILVSNTDRAVSRWLEAVQAAGGHLAQRRNDRVVCRIPAEEFFTLTDQLRAYGRVLQEQIDIRDITREYLDLELRIRTAEDALARLTAILERAEVVEDILRIEQEIRRLTEEIERMKGQLRYYADQVAFSTLAVQFTSTAPEQRPVQLRTRSPFPWMGQLGVEQVLGSF